MKKHFIRYNILTAIILVLLPTAFSTAVSGKPDKEKTPLTIWLIPFEPPVEITEESISLKNQLSSFNQKWAASNITVLNTTVDP